MIIINSEANNVTASYKISAFTKDVIAHTSTALKCQAEINKVDASASQGEILKNFVVHGLESKEPAYLIGNKKYTYAQLIKNEFEINFPVIKMEIPNALKEYSENFYKHMFNLEKTSCEDLDLNQDWFIIMEGATTDILNICIGKIYFSGITYVQMLDEYCDDSEFENKLTKELQKVIEKLIDNGFGHIDENGKSLLKVDNIKDWIF